MVSMGEKVDLLNGQASSEEEEKHVDWRTL